MNIFFITSKINVSGGGSNTNTDLRIKALLENGHNVKVITLFSKYNELPEQTPYTIISYNLKPRRWILVNFFVYRIMKKYGEKTDLFYIDGPQFLWGVGFYKIFGEKPILMHLNVLPYVILEHGTKLYAEKKGTSTVQKIKKFFRIKIGKYVDIFFSKKIEGFTCTSPLICEQCRNFNFGKENLEILPEFINTNIFLKNSKKKSPAAPRNRLLYVGRLVPVKGVDLLIKAMSDLKNTVILDIVGDGPELSRLQSLAKSRGVDARIHFYGWIKRDELGIIYEKADIFVHPARWAEPLGIAVVEAMAAGLPVIIPKISGSAWAAGKAGLTFQNGDEKDLAKKITLLLHNDNLYDTLREHTLYETAKLDYRQWIPKFETLIRKLRK